jgi:protoheme IX farnesyltransferase
LGYAGMIAGLTAIVTGVLMVALAWQLSSSPSEAGAKRLFAFSILYLFVLFAALLVERALGLQGFGLLGRMLA